MIVLGVVEDQWQDLLKVCANFLIKSIEGEDLHVKAYLIPLDAEIPDAQDVSDFEDELKRYHPRIRFPEITVLPAVPLSDGKQTADLLDHLANDNVDVIVSDSKIGKEEVAGLQMLHAALTQERFRHRDWTGYLMTKQFESASKWIYAQEHGLVNSSIRFLDKTALIGSFPDECSGTLTELIEREVGTRRAARTMAGKTCFGEFIGSSKSLTEGATSPYARAEIAARTNSSILIRGESGVGKEVMARAIHNQSARRAGPFVAVDCGALVETMIESELFGHVKGSFTGASSTTPGKIVAADHGTLFLDEITNMPVSTQMKFLRVLGEQEVTPVGEHRSRKVDFRLIAATNADVEELIGSGKFLWDLFCRITTWEITVPPLRERREDILALVRDLIPKLSKKVGGKRFRVETRSMAILQDSVWPENVRGLAHCLERAMGLALYGNETSDEVTVTEEHIQLALATSATRRRDNPKAGPALLPDPDQSMSPEEIWLGIRDGRLRRQSLSELAERLGGTENLAPVLELAEESIGKKKGLDKYFPGSTLENKRAIKSRFAKKKAKDTPRSA